jgi:hypothetical protein
MSKRTSISVLTASANQEAANEAFWKLSPAEQRVRVAIDTIQQIFLNAYKAKTGRYFELSTDRDALAGTDIQKLIQTRTSQGARCEVCARGAVFASVVRLGDRARVPQTTGETVVYLDPGDRVFQEAEGVFDRQNLLIMEAAFERYSSYSVAYEFGRRFKTDRSCLLAIMQNVIDHNGMFDPSVLTERPNRKAFFKKYPL